MKKIFSVLIVLLLCSGSVFVKGTEAKQIIRIGYFNVPPFIIYDREKNKVAGALYEFLAHYMGPSMGVEFAWDKAPTTIPRQINSLSTGSIDAAALLTYTPQRAQKMVFTEKPGNLSSQGQGSSSGTDPYFKGVSNRGIRL